MLCNFGELNTLSYPGFYFMPSRQLQTSEEIPHRLIALEMIAQGKVPKRLRLYQDQTWNNFRASFSLAKHLILVQNLLSN